jgi:predicted acyltransferase
MRGAARRWTSLWTTFGTNAITAYVFSELLASTLVTLHVRGAGAKLSLKMFVFDNGFAILGSPGLARLLYAIAFVAVCFLPVAWLRRKGIIIKV